MTGVRKYLQSVAEAVFYGNFFYGICAVFSAIESDLLQERNLNGIGFYVFIFLATVVFYNYPYARVDSSGSQQPRTLWHQQFLKPIRIFQVCGTVFISCATIAFVIANRTAMLLMPAGNWLLLTIFPLLGGLYYGLNVASARYDLRTVGWVKPFVIGLVWSGMTVTFPELYRAMISGSEFRPTLLGILIFLRNTMFLSVLAMMFDIKDYTADSRANLKTLVVRIGLRKLIFYVLLPLPLLGILTLTLFSVVQDFSLIRGLLLAIPILLLIPAGLSLRKRRSLLYYLTVIDGLILVKAILGIAASGF